MDDMYGGGSVLSYSKVPCTPVTGAFVNYYDVFGDVDRQQHRVGTGSSISSSCSSATSRDVVGGEGDDVLPSIPSPQKNPSHSASSTSSGLVMKISSASSLPFLCRSCNKRLIASGSSTRTTNKNDDIRWGSGGGRESNVHDSFEVTSVIQRDPYIVFLQEKQVEILGALHQEIRMLKHENAELKFQIHVILRQQESATDEAAVAATTAQRLCIYREKAISPVKREDRESIGMAMSVCGNREKILELELESATKMIQELKWVQQHYENKMRMQETKMEDLARQLGNNNARNSNNENLKAWPVQIQPSMPVYRSATETTTGKRPLKSGHQRGTSVQSEQFVHRRNSLQSILPNDYKEQVATLPPILAKQLGNPMSALKTQNGLVPFNSSSGTNKQYDNMMSKGGHRSSLVHTSTTGSAVSRNNNNNNNNTPAGFFGEDSKNYTE